MKKIYFDMDGTIADLYGQDEWLKRLKAEKAGLYETAKPLVDLDLLAKKLKAVKKKGVKVGVITWLAKGVSEDYHKQVTKEKMKWLKRIDFEFDSINIVRYGTKKHEVPTNINNDILFDDNADVRMKWKMSNGQAYDEKKIFKVLNEIIKN